MIRRRTALSVSAASALLLAAPLITACGGEPRPGAAAVVGGERITISQLQATVREVRAAQDDSPQARQLMAGSGRLSQDTLIRMIQHRVIERAAQDNGVRVTRREVQQFRKLTEGRQGGPESVRAAYLQQGIAPDQIDQQFRIELTRRKLVSKLDPQQVNQTFARTSKALHISVNPRYGTWDDAQGTTKLGSEPWLRTTPEGQTA
ncbi:SurA N-terminal domain-containing protein [Streptomyces palmae]|uniref:Lipoprotein n=1 Tax=Streptomyces palmae TaxID=1701085 RepID=A0A4Z0GCH7_9ACTN|nr:SurA N-terminal domain-containing protein [Streptomyces palmae]TGA93139.1 hypothetical protein E4099_26945 [Streptomyces palmae]